MTSTESTRGRPGATGATVGTAGAREYEGRQAPHAWRILALLALANVLNFYDRTIPAILVEEVKAEFGLGDTQIGLLGGVFIVVYAVAGIALGRMADRGSRRRIMGWGLVVWSVMTALSGGVWSFVSLLVVRAGVGIGEASYAPAANSTIADLFPPARRSRAVAVFQLGIPLGLILAFFTTGAIVDLFDSWRAPFLVAAVPGLVLAIALLRIDEPVRGASEPRRGSPDGPITAGAEEARRLSVREAVGAVWSIPTMRWLILSGIGVQVAAYSVATFLVPFFQRYHDLSLTQAGICAGVVLGFTGLVGLFLGGWAADRAGRRSPRGRVLVGAVALVVAAPLSAWAFWLGPDALGLFLVVMSSAWLLQFFFHTSALPAVSDVVAPALRSTAIAVFFALFYLLGGAVGPIITGALSDLLAAGDAAGGVSAQAHGLHLALLVVMPTSLLLSALGLFGASRHVARDRAVMFDQLDHHDREVARP